LHRTEDDETKDSTRCSAAKPRKPEDLLTNGDGIWRHRSRRGPKEIVLRLTRARSRQRQDRRNCVSPAAFVAQLRRPTAGAADGKFDEIWIQPAAGDAGGAVGAALATYYLASGAARPNGARTACAAHTLDRVQR